MSGGNLRDPDGFGVTGVASALPDVLVVLEVAAAARGRRCRRRHRPQDFQSAGGDFLRRQLLCVWRPGFEPQLLLASGHPTEGSAVFVTVRIGVARVVGVF